MEEASAISNIEDALVCFLQSLVAPDGGTAEPCVLDRLIRRDPEGALRYVALLRLIHANLKQEHRVSQRDLYYAARDRFADQVSTRSCLFVFVCFFWRQDGNTQRKGY